MYTLPICDMSQELRSFVSPGDGLRLEDGIEVENNIHGEFILHIINVIILLYGRCKIPA